jgi:integrase
MGVKAKKYKGRWYVFINHQGKRKAKSVGSRHAAEKVKREIEARIALGDFRLLNDQPPPTLEEYAAEWIQHYAKVECKKNTWESYDRNLRLYILPGFGKLRLPDITRAKVKAFLAEKVAGEKHSRNTIRLMIAPLRAILNHAIEDELIDRNPVLRIGRFYRVHFEARKPTALAPDESQRLLEAAKKFYPEYHPLFLCALRAGLRQGELLGLKWGDVQFGQNDSDINRYILVQRNLQAGRLTSTKNRKRRRVDLSRELKQVMFDLRDSKFLVAFQRGFDLGNELIFHDAEGRGLDRDVVTRVFKSCLARAGLREIRFHDLRHTFGSQLIQNGASLVYVRDQMGHSSIRVTADIYGHLLPSANVNLVDRLDAQTTPHKSATQAQPRPRCRARKSRQDVEKVGGPGGVRTLDLMTASHARSQLRHRPNK